MFRSLFAGPRPHRAADPTNLPSNLAPEPLHKLAPGTDTQGGAAPPRCSTAPTFDARVSSAQQMGIPLVGGPDLVLRTPGLGCQHRRPVSCVDVNLPAHQRRFLDAERFRPIRCWGCAAADGGLRPPGGDCQCPRHRRGRRQAIYAYACRMIPARTILRYRWSPSRVYRHRKRACHEPTLTFCGAGLKTGLRAGPPPSDIQRWSNPSVKRRTRCWIGPCLAEGDQLFAEKIFSRSRRFSLRNPPELSTVPR